MLELIRTRPKGKAEDVKQSRARSKEKPMSKVEPCVMPKPHKTVKETMEPIKRTVEPVKETAELANETVKSVKETAKPMKETVESVKETAKPVKNIESSVTKLDTEVANVSNNTMFILFICFNIDILALLILLDYTEYYNNGEL